MPDSNFLTDALDTALKRFGTYSYHDKGADEVMNVSTLVRQLTGMGADQVIAEMAVLAEHEHGDTLYDELYVALVDNARHLDVDELYQRLPMSPDGVTQPQWRASGGDEQATVIPLQTAADVFGTPATATPADVAAADAANDRAAQRSIDELFRSVRGLR